MNIYLHWRVLQTPFIPVIVIFCNIIETQDEDDAQRLKNFVSSLERGAHLSPSAREFYHMCEDLNRIAQKKMDARTAPQWTSAPSLSIFGLNQYFAANGPSNAESYRQISDLSNQDFEMMLGSQDVMGFF
ncbi:hypothetical protein CSHISOI_05475 [Colletotrichum shisoi]|uniref:Uncharacterized protein n=1 Tax=Colletotrichum shisoi TaxID=2078593 RepID=A0A5Q4BSR2_9PEZI|nr:hypothetical protein CSHISOI_05475 [Colletotrichum shisoi]